MKKQEAEIVDLEEVRHAKSSGSGGGYDHFVNMIPGTVFCCSINGSNTSILEEYMLGTKTGLTVLLQTPESRLERHLGSKFWQQHTMVQILHIPEQEKETEDGNGA